MENLIIEPLKGYGDIKFGMSIDEVVNVFGTPSNHEELEPIIEGNEISSILYDYDDIAVSVCFEGTDKLLGFAMINEYLQKFKEGHSIAEYLVIPKYRRNKIGKKIAFEIFDKFPGNWEVSPSYNSEKAYLFWKKTIEEYTNKNCKFEDGIFLFNNN